MYMGKRFMLLMSRGRVKGQYADRLRSGNP